jgi:hypothetical protein
MDEGALSQRDVIEASRRFVCIRLATYEDKTEAALLKSIFVGRSGDLENTTFAILSPDGSEQLVRSGRSPDFAFGRDAGTAEEMASTMQSIADEYGTKPKHQPRQIPKLADVRLALNVAACDKRPLVVAFSSDKEKLRELETKLASLAWSASRVGKFVYASTTDRRELEFVKGIEIKSGVIAIQPGKFGLSGIVLAQSYGSADGQDDVRALAKTLDEAERGFRGWYSETRKHISEGQRKGIEWETLLPVTDPGGQSRRGRR